ncbi:MAG: ATP-binding protein [Candidatus Krumholzibacteriota bacterium]
MKRLAKFLRPGRILRLQIILGTLVGGSLAYILINLFELHDTYQQTGSLQAMLQDEWKSGQVLTDMLRTGLFQLFVIILGWSAFFRLRVTELGNLRLKRSEMKYRSIINHAGEAIFLLDNDGRVLEWNKGAEDLFRLPRRNVLNKKIQKLDLDLDLALDRAVNDIQRLGRSFNYEARIEKENGPATQISLTLSRISPGAGPLAEKTGSFVVIARDITSEKQLESRMSETEKLAGIGQLAAGIAHQLNTPLGSILLSAQMLEDTVKNEDDSEDIHRIIRQTEQCRGIIKGLLNFARPTGSERGSMNLAEAISETAYLMEKNLKLAGVELNLTEGTDPYVFGNRNELEQVFFNLLANAIDSMPGGGSIDVHMQDGGPGEVMVEFRDTGEGIPRENHDRVFLPFFTTKDYGKGTGLGLSIVARIVHEHGGRIEMDSNPGKGTGFLLWLPRARNGISHGLSAGNQDRD